MDSSSDKIKGKIHHQEKNIPLVGFGTWQLQKQKASQVIYTAIKLGYRHIDCAAVYGNQIEVGQGIRKAIDQKIVTREDLFITGKLFSTFFHPDYVELGCKKSLQDLGLDYLDLYLMHNPVSLKFVPIEQQYPPFFKNNKTGKLQQIDVPVITTYKVMQELVHKGFVKSLGVSNFNIMLLRQLYKSVTIKPYAIQNQIHPFYTQKYLIRFCHQHNIHVVSYSTLGGSSYVGYGLATQEDKAVNNPIIKELAQKYKKTTIQIILRWAIQQNVSVIPKSCNPKHMKQNFEIQDWSLQNQDLLKIDSLNKNKTFFDFGLFLEKTTGTFYPVFG